MYAKGLIDESGCFKAEVNNLSLPLLNANEAESIKKFLEEPAIIAATDNAFKVSFKLSELLANLKSKIPEIEDIEIIGGSVPGFLPLCYLKRCFQALGIDNVEEIFCEGLLQEFHAKPGDYDIRISLKETYKDLPRDLSKEVVNFIAAKVYSTGALQKDQLKEVKDKAFIKFKPFVDLHNYYCITSFGNRQDRNIDLLHVKTLRRAHLFELDNLRISIQGLLGNSGCSFKINSAGSGYQAILDRLTGSLRVRDINTINEYGFPLLLSHLTKFRICPEPNTISDLRAKYLELLQDNKTAPLLKRNRQNGSQTPQPPIYETELPPMDRPSRISVHLLHCLENHHQNDPVSAFALTANTCLLLENALPSPEIKQLWQKMAPSFKKLIHGGAKHEGPEGLGGFLHMLMSMEKSPFQAISPLFKLRVLLSQDGTLLRKIRQETTEHVQYRMASKDNKACLLFPLDILHDCQEIARQYICGNSAGDGGAGNAMDALAKLFAIPLSTSGLQVLDCLNPEEAPSLEKLSIEWIEHPSRLLSALGYPLLQYCQHIQPTARTAALLIQHLPSALANLPALPLREALLLQVEAMLIKAGSGAEKWEAGRLVNILRQNVGGKTANDLAYEIAQALGEVRDPHSNAVAAQLYSKLMESNLPQEMKTGLSFKLIESTALCNLPFAIHIFRHCQQKLNPSRHSQHAAIKTLLDQAPKQLSRNSSAAQIRLLADSIGLLMLQPIAKRAVAKNKEPLPEISTGLIWIIKALIAEGDPESASKILIAASDQSLLACPPIEIETLWLSLCRAQISLPVGDYQRAAYLWKQGASKHAFYQEGLRHERQSLLIDLVEGLRGSDRTGSSEASSELLKALCREEIDPSVKERFDEQIRSHLSGLAQSHAYRELVQTLEDVEGAALSEGQQFEFTFKAIEGQLNKRELNEHEAGLQFKKLLMLAKEKTQTEQLKTLFLSYCESQLDNLPEHKTPEWHINQIRQLIADPQFAPFFNDPPEKKIGLLLACLELIFRKKNKDPRSLLVELLLNITGEVVAGISPAIRKRIVNSMIEGLGAIWLPTTPVPGGLKGECAKVLPILLENIDSGQKAKVLELIAIYGQHRISFSLTSASSKACVSAGLSALTDTPERSLELHSLFSILCKENGLAMACEDEDAVQFHRLMADHLLAASLPVQAFFWIERAAASNDSKRPYPLPAEQFAQWAEKLIALGQAAAAAKILSSLEACFAASSASCRAPWIPVIAGLHLQDPLQCAQVFLDNQPFIRKSDPEGAYEKLMVPLASKCLGIHESQALTLTLRLLESIPIKDPDVWLEFMRRIGAADKEKKQRMWDLYKTKCDSSGIFVQSPQKRAQCWLFAIKAFSNLKASQTMQYFLDNPEEVEGVFPEEAGSEIRMQACQYVLQWGYNHLDSTETPKKAAEKILNFKMAFCATLRKNNPPDACLAIESFAIGACLRCDSEAMYLAGIQALNSLLTLHQSFSNRQPPKILAEILASIPAKISSHKALQDGETSLALQSFYRLASTLPAGMCDLVKLIEGGILHPVPQIKHESIRLLEAFLDQKAPSSSAKKSNESKAGALPLRACLDHCLSSDDETLSALAVRCLEHSKLPYVLAESDICRLWYVNFSKVLTRRVPNQSVAGIRELIRYFENNIAKVNKNPETETQAIKLALQLISQILVIHHDPTQFIYITNRFMQWLINPNYQIIDTGRDESQQEMDLINTELDIMLAERTSSLRKMLTSKCISNPLSSGMKSQKSVRRPPFDDALNPQRIGTFKKMLIEILLDSSPRELATKEYLLRYVSDQIMNILDCNMVSIQDFARLVDRFAFAAIWYDAELGPKYRDTLVQMTYKGPFANHLRAFSESHMFQWMLLSDLHVHTQSIPGLTYKTYINSLTPQKRAGIVKEVIVRLAKNSTHYSMQLAMTILVNTQCSVLRDNTGELYECYRSIILALRDPPYCLERQYDHYSLLSHCIMAMKKEQSPEMEARASSLTVIFFTAICELYYTNPFNFQHLDIDFTGYAWALFSKELIPFTVAGDLKAHLKTFEAFMRCVQANIILRTNVLFANHIPETLETLHRAAKSEKDKELVCQYMAHWLEILAPIQKGQVRTEAARLHARWRIHLEKYPVLLQLLEKMMANIPRENDSSA